METPQPPVLAVPSDAPWQHRHPEAGEREALDQFEISARQEPRREHIHRRELLDDLLALEDAAGEDQGSAAETLRRGLEVVVRRRAVGEHEQIHRIAKELHL